MRGDGFANAGPWAVHLPLFETQAYIIAGGESGSFIAVETSNL